jgi:L-alanine-DL-glutamate epimerase-like enolase superfamily enzyme
MDINPSSKTAMIGAVLHKLSGDKQQYPWVLLGLQEPKKIRSSFTVGIDNVEEMLQDIRRSPYPIIKVKMGFDGDEELIPELSKISGKLFRIDANGGWTMEKAEKMIFDLARLEVDIIEQPTEVEFISQWPYLKRRAKVNLFVDEGMHNIDDYYRCRDYVDGINIKMAKAGGIIEGKRMALQAEKDRKGVMLGCMVESSIGISQAAYLSALADYFDLDGPLLLKEDIATGVDFDGSTITLNKNIIGGPKLKSECLEK